MSEPEIVEDPGSGRGIQAQEQRRASEQGGAVEAKYQEHQRTHQVCPANQTENAVPTRPDRKWRKGYNALTIATAKRQG